MNLLDSMIARAETTLANRNTPVIVSQQHDVNQIAIGQVGQDVRDQIDRLKDGRGGWDEAEYGISREAQIARLEAALAELVNDPKAVERELAAMRQRAIGRARLDTTGGRVRVMVAGEAPWHQLGVNVAEAVSSADAIRLAGLDWEVAKTQLKYVNPVTGQLVDAVGKFGITRNDNGEMLGTVGSMYSPIQNRDGFAFLDAVLGQFGAKFETAGSLYNGSEVWMQVQLPRQSFTLGEADRTDFYAIFTNSHDGTSTAKCFPTSHRVVCGNTFRVAMGDMKRGISIRHVGSIKGRIADAQQALALTVNSASDYASKAAVLASTKVDPVPFFNNVLDEVLDITEAQAMTGAEALAKALGRSEESFEAEVKRFQRQIDKRTDILEDILTRYESRTNGVDGMRGTGWAAFNAMTEAADHGKLGGRQVGEFKLDRKFKSVLTGDADEIKQVAYEQVLTLAN